MKRLLIAGILTAIMALTSEVAMASVTQSIAYKISVIIPEHVGITTNQVATGRLKNRIEDNQRIVQHTYRNNQPIVLETIVLK